MKRTYCDRCDKEIGNGESGVQRFTIFDNNKDAMTNFVDG